MGSGCTESLATILSLGLAFVSKGMGNDFYFCFTHFKGILRLMIITKNFFQGRANPRIRGGSRIQQIVLIIWIRIRIRIRVVGGSDIRDSGSENFFQEPRSGIRDPKSFSKIRHPGSGIRKVFPRSDIRDPGSEKFFQDPTSGIRDPKEM